jgi:hypothetical protein
MGTLPSRNRNRTSLGAYLIMLLMASFALWAHAIGESAQTFTVDARLYSDVAATTCMSSKTVPETLLLTVLL